MNSMNDPDAQLRDEIRARNAAIAPARADLLDALGGRWCSTLNWRMRQAVSSAAIKIEESANVIANAEQFDPWQVAESLIELQDEVRGLLTHLPELAGAEDAQPPTAPAYSLATRIGRLVHGFDAKEHKDAIRQLVREVSALEEGAAKLRAASAGKGIASNYEWLDDNLPPRFASWEEEIEHAEALGYSLVPPDYHIPHWMAEFDEDGPPPKLYVTRREDDAEGGSMREIRAAFNRPAREMGYPVYFKNPTTSEPQPPTKTP